MHQQHPRPLPPSTPTRASGSAGVTGVALRALCATLGLCADRRRGRPQEEAENLQKLNRMWQKAKAKRLEKEQEKVQQSMNAIKQDLNSARVGAPAERVCARPVPPNMMLPPHAF